MSTHRKRAARPVLAALATGGLFAGMLGLATASPASADPVKLVQKYDCVFPLINNDPITATITADIPTSIEAGKPSPAFEVTTDTVVSARAAQGMGLVGGKSIEGQATADVTVFTPDGPLTGVKVENAVAKTAVPSPPAEFHVPAKGKAPSLTFNTPGSGRIEVNSIRLHHMTVRDANGKPIQLVSGQDSFDVECKLTSSDKVLAAFTVTKGGNTTNPVNPDPVNPKPPTGSSADQNLTATVKPGSGTGSLSMSQAGQDVALSAVEQGKGGTSSGKLQTVTVSDQRGGTKGWSLTGKVTDFTATGGGKIAASKLSWKPSCTPAPGSASNCAPGTAGPVGTTGATLASAPDGAATGGKFTVDGGLDLSVPADAAAGDYKAVLTLTLT
ncbi:DUF6801 domain-containing protein [Streptomyces sp. NPDC046887]|uniref:DUF6801 domain-containing protein n=1 Tax=Streptomyces sp. NPDC046887 TaxID=3155472 RepID=UPI0033C3AFA7